MSYWLPIIYSRTYKVDFHMLAMPDFFTDENQKNWLTKHIKGTLINPGDFAYADSIRWSLFRNNDFCVIGTSCLVSNLIKTDLDENSKFFRLKGGGNPYAFVGCAFSKMEQKQEQLPSFVELKDSIFFADIYLNHLQKFWEKSSESTFITSENDKIDMFTYSSLSQKYQPEDFEINQSRETDCCIFTDDDDQKKERLLFLVSQSKYPNSICFGLPSLQYAKKTPFLNATVRGIDQDICISREQQKNIQSSTFIPIEKRQNKYDKEIPKQSPDERNNQAFNPDISTVESASQPMGETFQTSSDKPPRSDCLVNKYIQALSNAVVEVCEKCTKGASKVFGNTHSDITDSSEDLSNKPSEPTQNTTDLSEDLSNKPNEPTQNTTDSSEDLSNKPDEPAQVTMDSSEDLSNKQTRSSRKKSPIRW
jgi:hypothetical protein